MVKQSGSGKGNPLWEVERNPGLTLLSVEETLP